jgi:hypothetical protein
MASSFLVTLQLQQRWTDVIESLVQIADDAGEVNLGIK